jgi:ribonuclease E
VRADADGSPESRRLRIVPTSKQKPAPSELMIVNDVPGEECRIAILQGGRLDELYTERAATATGVGNIYKGRVTNVEPAIQAAFVDYGEAQSGFLHISDLHPRYFPGRRRTERVGKKIPRVARPPMQEALRRGDEVLVQVLKEGIGTKGPTLTSYLSIPGRMLVMMPEMDRVGVSRKVEDPERRRQMRDVLDSLKLPEGFGFILRTAGFGAAKLDLNRDAAYLIRLWKAMEKRIKERPAPCELYVESDLLVRTIRDILRPGIEAIVVDSEQAHRRAAALLQVVAPRSAPRLVRYRRPAPIFHAFDVERQLDLIHQREVPLPSGGKLVIEQTEALVAIDVNSGRSRSASDAETNAYETNCEAVEEICRQLRLRDLGGLVINDLIDMRMPRHRLQIEERFRHGLARDRAKTTMLRISEFGIVELTRQRMRPSLRKSHYIPCPACTGRGEIRSPDTVGADATRQAGYLLQFDRVRRVEMACSPRVASVLLSSKRRELVQLEEATGKKIDVRVSETIAPDRVDFYAYDDRNADVDVARLPSLRPPTLEELDREDHEPAARPAGPAPAARAPRASAAAAWEPALQVDDDLAELAEAAAPLTPSQLEEGGGTGRRRRRRGGRGRGREETAPAPAPAPAPANGQVEPIAGEPAEEEAPPAVPEPVAGVEPDGAPIRIHELARELGVSSRDLLSRCGEDVQAKSHMSSVTSKAAALIRRVFGFGPAESPKPAPRPEADLDIPDWEPAIDEGQPQDSPAADGVAPAEPDDGAPEARRPRRRGGRGRRRGGRGRTQGEGALPEPAPERVNGAEGDAQPAGRRSRRRRGRRSRQPAGGQVSENPAPEAPSQVDRPDEARSDAGEDARGRDGRRRRRRRGGAGRSRGGAPAEARELQGSPAPAPVSASTAAVAETAGPRPRRGLYRNRRPLQRGAMPGSNDE